MKTETISSMPVILPSTSASVLMFLRGQKVDNPVSNGYKDYIAPDGRGIDASLLNDKTSDQTGVYIFTPVTADTTKADMNNLNNLKYVARYRARGEVRDTIADILGDSRPRLTIVPYMLLNTNLDSDAEQMGTNARGTVLFQYDPDSDGKGTKAWRLFMENRFIYKKLP